MWKSRHGIPEWRPGFGPFARPELEDAVEHVERLAHLLRVRVRAEVEDAAAVPLAREHHPRVVVLDRDRDVRERLVVAQAHVERRPVALDEVLLEVERLDLAAGDDHLEVGDPRHELRDRGAAVAAPRLEVGAHARPQRLRLADVEHVALLVPEEVDARLRGRKRLQLLLDVGHLGYLSHGVKRLLAASAGGTRAPGGGARGRVVGRLRRRRGRASAARSRPTPSSRWACCGWPASRPSG